MLGIMFNREVKQRLKNLEDEYKYLRGLYWELTEAHNRLVEYLNVVEHKETVHEYRKKGGPEQA